MLLESSWNQMLLTSCATMKLETVASSAAVVMYTIVAEATVHALTALDQVKGVVRRRYSYGDTSLWAEMIPPGLEAEHRGGAGEGVEVKLDESTAWAKRRPLDADGDESVPDGGGVDGGDGGGGAEGL